MCGSICVDVTGGCICVGVTGGCIYVCGCYL